MWAKKPAIRKKVVMRKTCVVKTSTASATAAMVVFDDPDLRWGRHKREARVEHDPQQQGASPYGIQRVQPLRRGSAPANVWHGFSKD